MSRTVTQDPGERLDYVVNWSATNGWLVDGDTIVASTFTVPSGLIEDGTSFDDTTATVWLKGGTLNEQYTVTNHVVTAAGREGEWSFIVAIRDR